MRDDAARPHGLLLLTFLLEPSLALAGVAVGARALAEPSAASVATLAVILLAAVAPLPFLVRRAPAHA